jgi:hypothetical protein
MALGRAQKSRNFQQLFIDWSMSEHRDETPAAMTTVRRSAKVRRRSCLPVPRPLRTAVAAGIFGHDESGKPVRPSREEVRAITERHAERMVDMNDEKLHAAVTKYMDDFGSKAAAQLERYVRREQRSR